MKLKDLKPEFDRLQQEYGDKELDSVYGGGCTTSPDVCLIFMNPTKRNIASSKEWKGLKCPWIGTKNVWQLFHTLGVINYEVYSKINSIKGNEWTEEFAKSVYEEVTKNRFYITNLGKCTQVDARPLPDSVFKEYIDLLKKEIELVDPKVVILFGNQVSSIVLGEKIQVSTCRKQLFKKKIGKKECKFYPVYYPVGNGRFNIDKAIEDIKWIISHEIKEA